MTTQSPINSEFNKYSTVWDVIKGIDLKNKNAIVTGGYAGMGLEITKAMASAGATVYVPVRNTIKAKESLSDIANVIVEKMDLMTPDSIDDFAKRFLQTGNPLHLLINNAGLMTVPENRDSSGYISQFSTNNLGHFQLTSRLFSALKQANGARIVNVSSRAHRLAPFNFDDPNFEHRAYDKDIAYAESKTGNILFTVGLDKIGSQYGIQTFAVHPGMVPHTNYGKENSFIRRVTTRALILFAGAFVKKQKDENGKPIKSKVKPFFKSVKQGAATALWCATSPSLNSISGVYCEDCNIAEAVPNESKSENGVRHWAIDPEQAQRFFQVCEEYTGVEF